jgi:hypothetical protein
VITRYLLFIVLLVAAALPAAAQDTPSAPRTEVYTGTINADVTSKEYIITLEAGDAILIIAEAVRGDLDTVVTLYNPEGAVVAQNDDRNPDTFDSALGYIAVIAGEYRVEISRYAQSDTRGNYELEITIGDPRILDRLGALTGIQLSGEMLIYDTEHFRIHYTRTGSDRVTDEFVQAVARAAEEFYRIQIAVMGWAVPPSDGFMGGSPQIDIYLKDIIGRGDGALGYTSPRLVVGDNPNTPEIETNAAAALIVMDNDYADTDTDNRLGLMRATLTHELNHVIQFGYDVNDRHGWVYEATAVWVETYTAGKEQDGTRYVADAYQYPELCFGTDSDPGMGRVMYGEWPFIQMLVDDYGTEIVLSLWRNIALLDGFEALEATLAAHGATIPGTVARYRLKNLAREYRLAPLFNATVWRENVITGIGRWTYTGRGIQKLGANYYEVRLDEGAYYAGVVNDGGRMELWVAGIRDGKLDAMPLGRGGFFDNTGYDHVYLMVFDPTYTEDVSNCVYTSYEIDVHTAKSGREISGQRFDAQHFEPLR